MTEEDRMVDDGCTTEPDVRWTWTYHVRHNGMIGSYEVMERSYDRGRRCDEERMLGAFPAREDAERSCLWLRGWSLAEIDAGDVVYVREE